MSRIVLGKKYFSESEFETAVVTLEEFQKMLDKLFLLDGVLNIRDWIPWIDFMDLQGYSKMKGLMEDFVPKDMVDLLLQLADDPNLEVKLNYDSVRGFTQDLIVGGTDTSATTVEWAMYELMKQPHLIEKATEELDRPHTWLKKIATLLDTTSAKEPECSSTAGASAETLCFGTNRKSFVPRGFCRGREDWRGMCPGYSLGLKMISSSLANMLHGFHWKLPEDHMKVEDISMEEVYGLTTPRKHPLVAVMEP
ncbi:hypothetical protein EZV62_013030 [Acer yangbiense]|uniref:Uncharacterized protein n=1 Tax=Acer yangbiense TaxID=1000413 RepID=A0A5C7HX20_9ROSI|nr:hypothetical protein EZV62_013030 [Acer yangbiense]